MDEDVRPAGEPLEGRFSSPFDAPEGSAEARGHAAERLELLRCDPFERDAPESDRGADGR